MFENILDEKRLSLLKALTALDALDGFYLAGGTALSLQLGLRVSEDFVFLPLVISTQTRSAACCKGISPPRA